MSVTRTIPLPIHAGLEAFAGPAIMAAPFALGYSAVAGAIVVGLTGDVPGTIFLAGVGIALLSLTATTRFSYARGA